MQKIIDTLLSHPLYLSLGIATVLYLLWALFKRVLKVILLAALLFIGYLAWMYVS